MAKTSTKGAMVWDAPEDRVFESGVSKCALFVMKNGKYLPGVPWNGITSVKQAAEGAESNIHYADNIPYVTITSAEKAKGTIEAFTYPDAFAACDGTTEPVAGMEVRQQPRARFGLVYVTNVGDDADNNRGYKIHFIYNASASPSERSYGTINENTEPVQFSWEYSASPTKMTGQKDTAVISVVSTRVENEEHLKALMDYVYGTGDSSSGTEPTMPTPDEIQSFLSTGQKAAAK